MTKTKKTKTEMFLNSLLRGTTITRTQAKVWWKMKNPSSWVLRFENSGYDVSRVYKRKKNTRVVTYELNKRN